MHDFSIIIASWNARDYLLQCLESLEPQLKRYHAEIIVVDNASSDDSVKAVREKYPDVRVICNEANLGFAKANNQGMRLSSGRYLFLINSDVEVLPGAFDRLLSYMEEHPRNGLAGPRVLNNDRTLQLSCRRSPNLWNVLCRCLGVDQLFQRVAFHAHGKIETVEVINGCFWMIRREALDEVGLLDENFFMYGEDKDWCKRFRSAGWQVLYYPHAEVIHHGAGSSSKEPGRFYLELQRANLRYWQKHHGRIEQMCFLLISIVHHGLRVIGRSSMAWLMPPENRAEFKMKAARSILSLRWLMSGMWFSADSQPFHSHPQPKRISNG